LNCHALALQQQVSIASAGNAFIRYDLIEIDDYRDAGVVVVKLDKIEHVFPFLFSSFLRLQPELDQAAVTLLFLRRPIDTDVLKFLRRSSPEIIAVCQPRKDSM
jgi:hypothetical protein